MARRSAVRFLCFFMLLVFVACGTDSQSGADESGVRAGPGVDLARKVLRIGLLNDFSGPLAAFGKPISAGANMAVERVNAGGSGILPEGWTVELLERDHGYNPQRAVQEYTAIRDRVLFIAFSLGSPTTLPLRPLLARDKMVAFPAAFPSLMAEHEYTPPLGPSYKVEAARAMDWAVDRAGSPGEVRAAIVYQQDDLGQDGLHGWRDAAEYHGVSIVSEQGIASTQTDFTAVVSTLQSAGARFVLLSTIPGATQSILGIAKQLGYEATWIGQTPTWIDRFFDPSVAPPAIFDDYHWVQSLPYWGEDIPGMDEFLEAYEQYGRQRSAPEWAIALTYVGMLAELQVFRRALERGDVTREGFMAALRSEPLETGGFFRGLDFTRFPYEPTVETRILKPRLADRSWEVVAGYAAPMSYGKAKR